MSSYLAMYKTMFKNKFIIFKETSLVIKSLALELASQLTVQLWAMYLIFEPQILSVKQCQP
jgi:hypothetical protein